MSIPKSPTMESSSRLWCPQLGEPVLRVIVVLRWRFRRETGLVQGASGYWMQVLGWEQELAFGALLGYEIDPHRQELGSIVPSGFIHKAHVGAKWPGFAEQWWRSLNTKWGLGVCMGLTPRKHPHPHSKSQEYHPCAVLICNIANEWLPRGQITTLWIQRGRTW